MTVHSIHSLFALTPLTISINSSTCSYNDLFSNSFDDWCNFESHIIRSFRIFRQNSSIQFDLVLCNGFGSRRGSTWIPSSCGNKSCKIKFIRIFLNDITYKINERTNGSSGSSGSPGVEVLSMRISSILISRLIRRFSANGIRGPILSSSILILIFSTTASLDANSTHSEQQFYDDLNLLIKPNYHNDHAA